MTLFKILMQLKKVRGRLNPGTLSREQIRLLNAEVDEATEMFSRLPQETHLMYALISQLKGKFQTRYGGDPHQWRVLALEVLNSGVWGTIGEK